MKRARKKTAPARDTRTVPARETVRKKPKKKKNRFLSFIKALLIIAIVAIVGFFVLMGFGFVDESDLLAPIDRESGLVNALLLGVDEDGLRTDTIMVASFNLDTAELKLLSIPRDTRVYVQNRDQTRRLNEVHAMGTSKGIVGPVGTAQAVTQLTGIPINYYIEFSFDAIENLFKTLGPITYTVPDVEGGGRGMNYEDPVQDLYIHLKPGEQKLNSEQILQFMRYRKGDSDHARSERQQGIIKAMVEQKLGLSLIFKIPKIFSQLNSDLSTNLSVSDVSKYAKYLGDLSAEKISSYQLPGEDKKQGGKWYFICDKEKTKALVAESFGYPDVEINTTVTVDTEGTKVKTSGSKKTTSSNKDSQAAPSPEPEESETPTPTPTPASTPTPTPSPSPTPEEDEYISLD